MATEQQDLEPLPLELERNILETSYGLVENEKMSGKWLHLQCLFFVISAASGMVLYCSFSTVRLKLSGACIVNIKLVFGSNGADVVDEINSNWGSPALCDFCAYTPLTCSILAMVFVVYYMMSGRGGRGSAGFLAQPWRIVMPTILFTLLAFSVVFASTWLIYFGRNDFCQQISNRNLTLSGNTTSDKNTLLHLKLIEIAGCKNVMIPYDEPDPSLLGDIGLVSFAEVAGLLDSASWFLGFGLALLRLLMMPDFRLLRFDFILESSGKNVDVLKPTQSSASWAANIENIPELPGSTHSSDSALSTAQTALTSLDQQSLKQRYSSEEESP